MTLPDLDAAQTVGVVARQLGVSVRTLHHWDDLRVASPSGRTPGGYRAYLPADVARLRRALLLRDLDVPLDRIRFLLSANANDRRDELVRRRDDLAVKIQHLEGVAAAVDRMLAADQTGVLLSEEDQMRVFGDGWEPSWGGSARERWGDSAQWAEYTERSAQRTADDWQDIIASTRTVDDALATAKREGIAPGSDTANSLAERHRAAMSAYFHCTHSMHVLMARMYVTETGFRESYDQIEPGLAEWLSQVVDANAQTHGVDPETAVWE